MSKYILGNLDDSEFIVLDDLTIPDQEIEVRKNVLADVNVIATNKRAIFNVLGVYKEFGLGNEATNSYFTLSELKSFLSLQKPNHNQTDISDEQLIAHIIEAHIFIEGNFEFDGQKVNRKQGLAFPRSPIGGMAGEEYQVIPKAVKQAALEATYLSLIKGLQKQAVAFNSVEGRVLEKKEKIGVIEESTKYQNQKMLNEDISSSITYNIDFLKNILKDYLVKGSRGNYSGATLSY